MEAGALRRNLALKGRTDSHLATWFPAPVPDPRFIKQGGACDYFCDKPETVGHNGSTLLKANSKFANYSETQIVMVNTERQALRFADTGAALPSPHTEEATAVTILQGRYRDPEVPGGCERQLGPEPGLLAPEPTF